MTSLRFKQMFPWKIAKAMRDVPIGYLPLGTLEWHGKHNLVGLDTLKEQVICVRAVDGSNDPGREVVELRWSNFPIPQSAMERFWLKVLSPQ